MTIKLTHQQAEALYTLLKDVVLPIKPLNMAEKLLHLHIVRIFKKLRNRLEGNRNDTYNIALTDEEAVAYYVYFLQRSFGAGYQYEENFIQSHINQIDQIYA
jgi:hypothetical protein